MSAADIAAVTNLVLAYPELVDTGDFTGVGELFADAVFVSRHLRG
ncbi:nuclear transport factor 2 family protein [Streptomyces sp. NPDC006476]